MIGRANENQAVWRRIHRATGDEEHELVLFTHQENLAFLHEELMAISTPGNPKYGKHWTFEDIEKHIAAGNRARRAADWVCAHVEGARVVETTPRGEYVSAVATIAAWEKAFLAEFHHWISAHDNQTMMKSANYSLPEALSQDVSSIFGILDFAFSGQSQPPPLRNKEEKGRQLRGATVSEEKLNSVTPEVLTKFYDMPTNQGSVKTSQGVFASLGQTFSQSDLAEFQRIFGLPPNPVAHILGGHMNNTVSLEKPASCGEANLDVQYMTAVSRETPMTFFYDGARDAFLDFAWRVSQMRDPPRVLSISYGAPESWLNVNVMRAFDTEALKLGLMGVTIFVSSGDDGVSSHEARTNANDCGYEPSYPATSPYVTAVGATNEATWATPGQGEVVCQSNVMKGVITSGGGFSLVYGRPEWQTSAVDKYFETVRKEGKMPASGYNLAGRAYPDLALAGRDFEVVIGGRMYKVSGTSASSPSMAGIFALVNARRAEAGLPPVGFVNPALYSEKLQNMDGLFNDVTSGDNKCTANVEVCCKQGFYAANGWDPTTGFGSVNVEKLFKAFGIGDTSARVGRFSQSYANSSTVTATTTTEQLPPGIIAGTVRQGAASNLLLVALLSVMVFSH